MAKVNPFRFSTKYQDDETDLLYYGKRYLNTSTGRWSSRDPIGEYGGKDLYSLVGNNPVNRIDVLGQGDFVWEAPEFHDGGHPGSGGVTMWWKFAPQAEVYCRWSGCCCGVRLSGGVAGVFGIINEGSLYGESIEAHEQYHVDHHFKPAYTDYKSAAAGLGAPCLTKGRAMCLKAVIESELAKEYAARAIKDATQYDWDDYGRNNPNPETKQDRLNDMTQAAMDYAAARAATVAAAAACKASNP